jgi:hypothetical protein
VEDAVAVALERRAQPTVLFGSETPTCFVGAHGLRRQRPFLVLTNLGFEGIGDLSGKFGHRFQAR